MEWISVEERLPTAREDVLLLINTSCKERIIIGWYSEIRGWKTDIIEWLCYLRDCTVTHWMPLPEPPGK